MGEQVLRHPRLRQLVVALWLCFCGVGPVTTAAAPLSAPALYADAMGKEAAVRKALADGAAAASVGRALRSVLTAYEAVLRHYPTSGYCDDALWRAAQLALDAAAPLEEPLLRTRAQRYLQRLAREYPSSKYARQIELPATLADTGTQPTPAIAPPVHSDRDAPPSGVAATPPAAGIASSATPPVDSTEPSAPPRSESTLVSVTTTRPAPRVPPDDAPDRETAATPAEPARLLAIHRTVLPDVVRITLDIDREVTFMQERLSQPDRIFFDLAHATSSRTLSNRTLQFSTDRDIVGEIRVGRPFSGTVRVVLDASGVSGCNASPLYSPYRLVIDCTRETGGTVAGAGEAGAAPPVPNPSRPTPLTPATFARRRAEPSEPASAPRRSAPSPAEPSTPRTLAVSAPPLLVGRATVSPLAAPSPLNARSFTVPAATLLLAGPSPIPASFLTAVAASAAVVVATPPATPSAGSAPPEAPARNLDGGFSLARQLGLRVSRIVVDPGHGGHDPGAKGGGTTEAALVLDIALRLEKRLQEDAGVEVVLTRRTDAFVPLEERTAIANRAAADLFLSIHTNASSARRAAGVETYYLNFASTAGAAGVAARENAASGQPMSALPDFVKAIATNDKQDESRDLAVQVQRSLVQRLRPAHRTLRDLGVKQAPFVVLIGASMPSVLAEVSFLTNQEEARLLKGPSYRQRIADALFDAVQRYQQSLSHDRELADGRGTPATD
ncbi:MAG: N-acetylmuramoyl-L-alanine amidase [Vicinamibacterales bacterium]